MTMIDESIDKNDFVCLTEPGYTLKNFEIEIESSSGGLVLQDNVSLWEVCDRENNKPQKDKRLNMLSFEQKMNLVYQHKLKVTDIFSNVENYCLLTLVGLLMFLTPFMFKLITIKTVDTPNLDFYNKILAENHTAVVLPTHIQSTIDSMAALSHHLEKGQSLITQTNQVDFNLTLLLFITWITITIMWKSYKHIVVYFSKD